MKFHFLHVAIQLSKHHLLKKLFFPHWILPDNFVAKSADHRYMSLFLDSSFLYLPHTKDCLKRLLQPRNTNRLDGKRPRKPVFSSKWPRKGYLKQDRNLTANADSNPVKPNGKTQHLSPTAPWKSSKEPGVLSAYWYCCIKWKPSHLLFPNQQQSRNT